MKWKKKQSKCASKISYKITNLHTQTHKTHKAYKISQKYTPEERKQQQMK